MKTLGDIGEAGLIARLQALVDPMPGVIKGIGDDAAVYGMGSGRALLVTVDTMVAAEHFLPDRMPFRLVGRKAMASSVSDIVAMNGQPQCAVVSLSSPGTMGVAAIDSLYQGLQERAQEYGVALVGGDTTRSRLLTISVTVVGEALQQDVVLRSGAQPGDVLCVTGMLGASHAGLQWMLAESSEQRAAGEAALKAHFDPAARLDVILDWRARGVRPHALTDISDGLATEIHHLCDASRCGAIVDAGTLPVSAVAVEVATLLGEDALDYALFWGEDYELVFAASEKDLGKLDPSTYTAIGRFTAASDSVMVKRRDGRMDTLPRKGWEHFVT